jgi:sugar (pentulose or hexulose) kinase
MNDMHTFIGLDVGTQGARAVLADAAGNVLASAEENFPLSDRSREEQCPDTWWQACTRVLEQVLENKAAASLLAISVTSTSGTIIPINKNNEPLHPAIMYSDGRQAEEGALCKTTAALYNPNGYTAFNTSSGLPKMLWFLRRFPEKAGDVHLFIHAADYITGKLSGRYDVTDFTNVLKSGYDVRTERWPEYIWDKLPLRREWLQTVVPSGTPVGPATAAVKGLNGNVTIVAGMTDGCASQIASGAVSPGTWNTTIGTTLVVKGVTHNAVKDPQGRLYNHRHPEGFWMPGGASNTGADWITRLFGTDLAPLNEAAAKLLPTQHLFYPLMQQGERFPFIAPQAQSFETPGLTDAERFTAGMEGVAYVERLAYEVIEQLSGEKVNAVYTAGGASNSDAWLTIRANVLNRPVHKMKEVTGAAGAAILAASGTHFRSLREAAAAMTQIEKTVSPQPALAAAYENNYHRFIRALKEKGYA